MRPGRWTVLLERECNITTALTHCFTVSCCFTVALDHVIVIGYSYRLLVKTNDSFVTYVILTSDHNLPFVPLKFVPGTRSPPHDGDMVIWR